MEISRVRILLFLVVLTLLLPMAAPGQEDQIDRVRDTFVHPPDDARVMMRWWWFGPAVTKPELERELETMKAGGIGGAEIQPVYPLELDDPQTGFRNIPFASPEYLDLIRFASEAAYKLDLRLSLTLGSGWPYGGSYLPVTEAAGRLRIVVEPVSSNTTSIPVPSIRNGEKLLAVFLATGTPERYDADHAQHTQDIHDGRLDLPASLSGPHVVLFFLSSRTGQQVKRAAAGAEGFVLDHFSQAAVQDHLKTIAEPLLNAFGDHPPSSVFSDSLEVYGADWTPDLLEQFRTRRGYDLTPYLPELAAGAGTEAEDVRFDWGRTLAELIDENYLTPINTWARAHHTQFRSQTYGSPAVTLSSNNLVDLPEGEGSQWRSFSYTRWATSASHVYGRPITSSETWTWLHSPAFRATPLDMKAEADTFFLQGINQLMGHGWPYSPPSAGEPGWSFYAAAVFNNHNPWWIVMPEVMTYLQRMSYLMRTGKPANDVAIFLPTADAQARFRPGHVSVTDEVRSLLGPNLIPQILESGYGFDFIDAKAIEQVGIHYPILVLPGIERIPLAAYRKIQDYERNGGIVIATESLPSRAPGLKESQSDTNAVKQISSDVFAAESKNAKLLPETSDLGQTLHGFLEPDVSFTPETPQVGFIHRKLRDSEIYFIANSDSHAHTVEATFRATETGSESWDPFTGHVSSVGRGHTLALHLAPYESRVVVFSNTVGNQPEQPRDKRTPSFQPVDLNSGWKVTFEKTGFSEEMQTLRSWSDDKTTEFYSGTVTYERTFDVPVPVAHSQETLLDFGEGTPVPPAQSHFAGMRAWLEGPVREAALVYVNGKFAGSVWHPPYRLNLSSLLHAGSNRLKIVVANTAINELSGKAAPDYRLLTLRYGERFTPQDMDHLEPLPSGILGPLRLIPGG